MELIKILVVILVIVLLLWQLSPFIRARMRQGKPAPDYSEFVDEEKRQAKKLLFYFWSPSCGMCRNVTPVIDALAETRNDVVKVNVMEQADLTRRFKVLGTPTLVLVQDGQVEKMLLGVQSEKNIQKLLNGP
jgi:thioredoxin 1